MNRLIRTAVAASATPMVQRQLPRLLAGSGIDLVALAGDGRAAWDLLMKHRPDLLVTDLELPVMDGALLARRALDSFELPVRPAALLLRYPEFSVPGEQALAQSGAVLIEKPLDAAAFSKAIDHLRDAQPQYPAEAQARADRLLDALGVPRHAGRECLKLGALICAGDVRALHNLRGRVYPIVGEICGLTPQQAERAMRHAIDLAWRSDQVENQYRIFADTIDARRGQPTCGEMISRLADILRLEG